MIIKYKFLVFLGIALLLTIGILGLQNIVIDSSNESFLPENDEAVTAINRLVSPDAKYTGILKPWH